MLDRTEFDTIYLEHQCYFSATALDSLFARHDLELCDVERIPIHGGSLRVFAAPAGSRPKSERLMSLLAEEHAWGVSTESPYAGFAAASEHLRTELLRVIDSIKTRGVQIAAYGAAAKGVTLLSFCGIGAKQLDFVVDRSTYKQGKRFPVGGLPILPPEALLERRPDYALLLTWNFAD